MRVLLLLFERVTARIGTVRSLILMTRIKFFAGKFGRQVGIRMLVHFDHNDIRTAVVPLSPVSTVRDGAFDFWHIDHPQA